jgi:hypothetical protein
MLAWWLLLELKAAQLDYINSIEEIILFLKYLESISL